MHQMRGGVMDKAILPGFYALTAAALLAGPHAVQAATSKSDLAGASRYLHGDAAPGLRLNASLGQGLDYGDNDVRYRVLNHRLEARYNLTQIAFPYAAHSETWLAPADNGPAPATTAPPTEALALAKSNQNEIGVKGSVASLDYRLALNTSTRQDTTPGGGGKTRQRGVEAGLGWALSPDWRLDSALSYARHTYQDWGIPVAADYGGRKLESGPSVIGNLRLTWQPVADRRMLLEWVKSGESWRDPASGAIHEGCELVNLRANLDIGKQVTLHGSIHNLLDRRYGGGAALSAGGPLYAPGLPRTLFIAIAAKW